MAFESEINQNENISTDIVPNILDEFSSWTYQFTLSLASEYAIRNKEVTSNEKVIVAQSGSTSVGVDSVAIESLPGMSANTTTGLSTKFDIKLRQPLGVNVLDQIQAASAELGINSYMKTVFILELRFLGRDPDTSLPTGSIGNNVWVWPIFIKNIEISVDEGGSTYDIEAVHYNDIGESNEHGSTRRPMEFEVGTIGEFLEKLEEELENQSRKRAEEVGFIFEDTYNFRVDNELAGSSIVPDETSLSENGIQFERTLSDPQEVDTGIDTIQPQQPGALTGGTTQTYFQPRVKVTINDNTSIRRIIEMALTNCAYYKNKISEWREDIEQQTGENFDPDDAEISPYKQLFRVFAETEQREYDFLRQDYAKNITYNIIKYDLAHAILRRDEARGTSRQSQRSFNDIKNTGQLKKRYDYFYTGINDQLLSFDLNFNYAWYATLPEAGGHNTQPSSSNVGVSIDEDQGRFKENIKEINEKLNQLFRLKFQETRSSLVDMSLGPRTTPGDRLRRASGLAPDDSVTSEEEIQQELVGLTRELIEQEPRALTREDIVRISNETQVSIQELVPDTSIEAPASNTPRSRFAEDSLLNIRKRHSDGVYSRFDNTSNRIPLSFFEDDVQVVNQGTQESEPDKSMPLISALFNQAVMTDLNADLINVEMNIKGDPFWLQPGPAQDGARVNFSNNYLKDNEIGKKMTSTDVTANPLSQQTFVLFTTQTPMAFDENTGLTEFTSSTIISGVYFVKRVTSIFQNGEFTQTLESIRQPQIFLEDIDDSDLVNPRKTRQPGS